GLRSLPDFFHTGGHWGIWGHCPWPRVGGPAMLLDKDVAQTIRRKLAGVLAAGLAVGAASTVVATVDSAVRAPAAGATVYLGSAARLSLVRPIVDMASTPTGKGYWLVASDGGIFSYGDAHFHGSTGGRPLNKPIVGMTATRDGGGYWFV